MFFTAMSVMNGVGLHRQYQAEAPAGNTKPTASAANVSISATLPMWRTLSEWPVAGRSITEWQRHRCRHTSALAQSAPGSMLDGLPPHLAAPHGQVLEKGPGSPVELVRDRLPAPLELAITGCLTTVP
jgi:hypothetical protein